MILIFNVFLFLLSFIFDFLKNYDIICSLDMFIFVLNKLNYELKIFFRLKEMIFFNVVY